MNPELRAKLARLSELSDDELTGIRLEIIDAHSAIDTDSAGSFATLHACTDAADLVSAEVQRREHAAAAAAEAVTASGARGSRIARMAARQGRPQRNPEAADQTPTTTLVASGEVRGVTPGTPLDREKLAVAMTETLFARSSMVPKGPPGGRGTDVLIASASWADQYPEDRKLLGQDRAHNDKVFDQALNQSALVATGGICAPVNVDWSINMIATADRPLQAALPAFQAGRGGLIYRQDFDFSIANGGVGIWTEATDLSPAGATKPIATIACPGTDTVYVEAVSTRLGFGNMQSRFDPETVAAANDAILASAARTAENNLLNLIAAQATQGVTTSQVLGATRDLLTAVGQCIAAFRNLHRIGDSQKVRAIFPDWVKQLIRVDMARETAHAQDTWNSLMVTDEQIEDMFDTYGVSPIWHLDGQGTSSPGVAVAQYFSAQSGSGTINKFPSEVTWYLYYEGAIQYLDGGRLDLGVVRDSLLDSTNDFEVFAEQFETIAYRGFTGGLIQINSTLCANGESAATVSTTSSCA